MEKSYHSFFFHSSKDILSAIDDLNTPLFGPAEPSKSGGGGSRSGSTRSSSETGKNVNSKQKSPGRDANDDEKDSSDSESGTRCV